MTTMKRDYLIQAAFGHAVYAEDLLIGVEREEMELMLEQYRANFPGCETRVYTCNADEQGGTVNIYNLKREL